MKIICPYVDICDENCKHRIPHEKLDDCDDACIYYTEGCVPTGPFPPVIEFIERNEFSI